MTNRATKRPYKSEPIEDQVSHVGDAAANLLSEGKKFVNELYQTNVDRLSDAQDNVKENVMEYSSDLAQMIKKNPFYSILIAAGIGFILSFFFRK